MSRYQYFEARYWYFMARYQYFEDIYWYFEARYRYFEARYRYFEARYHYFEARYQYFKPDIDILRPDIDIPKLRSPRERILIFGNMLYDIIIGRSSTITNLDDNFSWFDKKEFDFQMTAGRWWVIGDGSFEPPPLPFNNVKLPKMQTIYSCLYAGRPLGRYYRPLVDNRPFCLNGRYSWICGRCYIKMVDISSK